MSRVAAAHAAFRYDNSVYINCPFDRDYRPFMDAIIFTVVACGFQPRSALETGDSSEGRLERIHDALSSARLSIHDLSHVHADKETGLARLNMSLELGIAIALKLARGGKASSREHRWTAVFEVESLLDRAVSDLKGFDGQPYATREELVSELTKWLKQRLKGRTFEYTPKEVFVALEVFDGRLKRLVEGYYGKQPGWGDIVKLATSVAREHKLEPYVPPQVAA